MRMTVAEIWRRWLQLAYWVRLASVSTAREQAPRRGAAGPRREGLSGLPRDRCFTIWLLVRISATTIYAK